MVENLSLVECAKRSVCNLLRVLLLIDFKAIWPENKICTIRYLFVYFLCVLH